MASGNLATSCRRRLHTPWILLLRSVQLLSTALTLSSAPPPAQSGSTSSPESCLKRQACWPKRGDNLKLKTCQHRLAPTGLC